MIVAAGILAPTLFLLVSVALPGVAEARCVGSTPVTSTLIVSGSTVVSETPASGTCNGNNEYGATFRSHTAGWRATVWIQNGGIWREFPGHYDTATYSYSYVDDNSHSLMSLCLDHVTVYICGWGTNYVITSLPQASVLNAYNGVNSGF